MSTGTLNSPNACCVHRRNRDAQSLYIDHWKQHRAHMDIGSGVWRVDGRVGEWGRCWRRCGASVLGRGQTADGLPGAGRNCLVLGSRCDLSRVQTAWGRRCLAVQRMRVACSRRNPCHTLCLLSVYIPAEVCQPPTGNACPLRYRRLATGHLRLLLLCRSSCILQQTYAQAAGGCETLQRAIPMMKLTARLLQGRAHPQPHSIS